MAIKNTSDLRGLLIETIDGIRTGTIDPRQAQAISSLSCRILQSAKLDLEAVKFYGAKGIESPSVPLIDDRTSQPSLDRPQNEAPM